MPNKQEVTDEDILEFAKHLDFNHIYDRVCKLLEVAYEHTASLAVKKMEFKFLHEEPKDEEFISYLECLTEAHNQMLFYVYDPNNNYKEMNYDPLENANMMHGVPDLYREILAEVLKIVHDAELEF
jgi:hypothetical protein